MQIQTTILIVDDSSENIKLLGNSLKNANFNILAALNGRQAIALAEGKQPDLIILDVMMPEMNGFEVCLALKENESTAHIPIIFLTASVELESIKTGFAVGAIDYIAKPFNPEELLLRVKNHLNQKIKKDLLEKKLKYRTTLLRDISNEILTPLTSLLSDPDLILRETGSQPFVQQLTKIETSLIAINKLTDNLIQFSNTIDNRYDLSIKSSFPPLQGFTSLKSTELAEAANQEKISRLVFDKKNILVVEDNELNQRLMVSVLECFGALVTIANNGEEALELVSKNTYHIILMDVNVPILNGIEVTKILRTKYKVSTPIIAISGHSDKSSVQKCLDVGMNTFLLKPFEIGDLQNILLKELEKAYPEKKEPNLKYGETLATVEKEPEKYSLSKINELSNGDDTLVRDWTNRFRALIRSGRNEIDEIINANAYLKENKIFHELNNYTSYFGVDLLREYLKDLPQIHKSSSTEELMDHFRLIAEELECIDNFFDSMNSNQKNNIN